MRIYIKIAFLLLISFKLSAQKRKIELTSFLSEIIDKDSSVVFKEISTYSKTKVKKLEDEYYFPEIGINLYLNQNKILSIKFDNLTDFYLKNTPLKKEISIANLKEIYEIEDRVFGYNNFNIDENTILQIEGTSSNLSLKFQLVSPKKYFHSDIVPSGNSIYLGNISSIAPKSFKIKTIEVFDNNQIFPPMPGSELFEAANIIPREVYSLFRNNEFDKGLTILDKFIEEHPSDLNAIQLKISVLTTTEKYLDAIKVSETHIEKYADFTETDLLNLIELYLITDNIEKALDFSAKNDKKIVQMSNRVLLATYRYIANVANNNINQSKLENIEEVLPYINFSHFRWSFSPLQKWLSTTKNVSPNQRQLLLELLTKIEQTKK